MKRSNKQKLQGFLRIMREEYKRCTKKGHRAKAVKIRKYLQAHLTLMGVKDAA